MLQTHFQNSEKHLLAQYNIPAITGHCLHKGNPREAFVKEFLEHHLPSLVDIGTGEIIDKDSRPGESRNQHDIVVFQKTYPKLNFGGNTQGFLIESVNATIEVKSLIDKEQIRQAVRAAYRVKHLKKGGRSGITIGNPSNSLFSGVVAYAGPENMVTVAKWLRECEEEFGIVDVVSQHKSIEGLNVLTPSLDAVLLLGKGIVYNINQHALAVPVSDDKLWCSVESSSDNLLVFFVMMLSAIGTIRLEGGNLGGYIKGARYSNVTAI